MLFYLDKQSLFMPAGISCRHSLLILGCPPGSAPGMVRVILLGSAQWAVMCMLAPCRQCIILPLGTIFDGRVKAYFSLVIRVDKEARSEYPPRRQTFRYCFLCVCIELYIALFFNRVFQKKK